MPLGGRKIGISVDLSPESLFAVKWAVSHYVNVRDTVVLLHVQPTDILYGADWGEVDKSVGARGDGHSIFSTEKGCELLWPLVNAGIPYKIHIVKDHDLKERICLEAERLKVDVLIMGSNRKNHAGSVSDYCVHHCDRPVIVVQYQEDEKMDALRNQTASMSLESKM